MNKIIISINPNHVKNILNGTKKYEYRRIAAKKDVSSILIYETYPTKMVVAEAEVEEILRFSPEELWEKTKDFSGIDKEFFDNYFSGKEIAYAYKLKNVKKVMNKPLIDYGIKVAPQSFVYYKY